MKDSKVVKFAAVSCLHCPFQNREAVQELCLRLEEHKPQTFVLCGDLFESDAASVHPRDGHGDLTEEYAEAGQLLKDIRLILGRNCNLVWCLGNHDDNLQAPDPRRIPKSLRKAVHWNRDYDWGSEFRRWKQVPYVKGREGCYELGQVIFYHGYDCANGSDRTEGLQMANACGGHAHRLTVRGHTHRPVPVTQAMLTSRVPLPYWYANVGTLGQLSPEYMRRKDRSQWGSAVLLGSCEVQRASRRTAGRCWDADLVLL